MLFVIAIGCSFIAINLLDSVAIATGIWCGVAMIASFLAGACTGDKMHSSLAVIAMALMIIAVYRMTNNYLLSARCVTVAECAAFIEHANVGCATA
jgi:hypothetical protein